MSFDLVDWLADQIGHYALDIPLIDLSNSIADERREWLITNGLGSFASGNLWGATSRRYHGLGIFSMDPPARRMLLLTLIDETACGERLGTNFWTSGAVSPEGYKKVVAVTVYPVPTWVFEVAGGYLIKQVAMLPERQEVTVGYTWTGESPLPLCLRFLTNCRDFHGETRGSLDWRFEQDVQRDRVRIRAYSSAPELVISFSRGSYQMEPLWYWNYYWPREHERGQAFREDNFHSGRLETSLEPGASITVRAGLDRDLKAVSINDVVRAVARHQNTLIEQAGSPADQDVRRLIVAADQFIVDRDSTASKSIIAGYHWFADWGRDSMISVAGLALSTKRFDIARAIFTTFGSYLSGGMLPNSFPDSGMTPLYNTVDATLWWAWALDRYYKATRDTLFIADQVPLLESVVEWHLKGTRYNIHVDPADGLISCGEQGVQLTWMDVKAGSQVVTQRAGKPVEINALWFNFLKILQSFCEVTERGGEKYAAMAEQAKTGFERFWNAGAGCLFDVIREDGTADASIRPNQLLAISLPHRLVSDERAKSILAVVERELLTPGGLRTLSPLDPAYRGRYGGGADVADQYNRDITYHQGTVWPWLFGPWVDARVKTYGLTEENRQFMSAHLAHIKRHVLGEAGVGSVSEIFDGVPPHHPAGCVAQAWSVAELLRVLSEYKL